ncbi:MAG: hypothetical protein Q3986_08095 [Akkermansia sp.]|nr:hypothetical protein [Akkermansia sp.]
MKTRLTPDIIRPILRAAQQVAAADDIYAKAVFQYAYDLLDGWQEWLGYPELTDEAREKLAPQCPFSLPKMLLNGAENWKEYSQGACHAAIVNTYDITCRLHGKEYADAMPEDYFHTNTPTEEEARALSRAAQAIRNAAFILFMAER